MKYRVLIIGLVIFALGAALFFGAWASLGFGAVELSNVEYEKRSREIDWDFHSLHISESTDDVHIEPAYDGVCRIEYVDSNRHYHKISVENGCLEISREKKAQEGSWFDNITLSTDFEENLLVIYLPEAEYKELTVHTASADVYAGMGFSFERAEIHTASGDVDIGSVVSGKLSVNTASGDIRAGGQALREMELNTSSGSISLGDASVGAELSLDSTSGDIELSYVNCGELEADSASGRIELRDVIASRSLDIETTSGDIRLERCDAASLELESTSGYISGTLLSGKDFDVSTNSGDIDLPSGSRGGKCRISTTSGDIRLSIE